MSRAKKLVYQVFNCETKSVNSVELRVNNKETERLVRKGIEAERNANMRSTRTMFSYMFIMLISTYLNNSIDVKLKHNITDRRVGVTSGKTQKVDVLLTNKKNFKEYAVILKNINYSKMDKSADEKSRHICKTYKGNCYYFYFNNFLSAASNIDKFSYEVETLLKEMKKAGVINKTKTLPTILQIRECFDRAIELTIDDQVIKLEK